MLKVGALVSLLAFTACGVGDDDGVDPNGRTCTTTYTTTGNVTGQTAVPDNNMDGQPDISGCWPQGTWKFRATADGGNCSPEPVPLPEYEIKIDYGCFPAGKNCGPDATPENAGEYGFQVNMITETPLRKKLKYSSGGGGLCYGGFELFSDNGLEVWNFKPTLNADLTLGGIGEFSRFNKDQFPLPED